MTSSPNGARIGSQTPRIEHYPAFFTSAADDAVDLAAIAGLHLDPWQEHVLRASLGERQDGRWSAFRTCLVVPRQNGKNAILEARELAGLFLFDEKLIVHTAHQFKTAYKAMIALMNRIKAVPDLLDHVYGYEPGDAVDIRKIDGFKTGNNPGIELKAKANGEPGNKLEYYSRSGDSGRGFTGDLVILDEAYALSAAEMGALLPTMAATSIEGNPQVWLTSSAGKPKSDYLAAVRQQGMDKSSDRLAYFEWSTPDDTPLDDVDGWYQANPGMGFRISEEFVRDELESLQTTEDGIEEFQRERQGIWAKLGSTSVFNAGVWGDLADEASRPGDGLVFAVEISGNRDSASIVSLSQRPDGLLHVEVVENELGTSWIGSRLAELQAKWKPLATLALSGGHVDSLLPSWKKDGARVRLVSWQEYVKACGRVFDMVEQGKIRHVDDELLNAAVDGVQQTWTRDNSNWYWSRKRSDIDITPLVALTVALAGFEKRSGRKASEKKPSSGRILVLGR